MDLSDVTKAAEQQGWRIEPTRDGYMLYPPDRTKTPVLVHRHAPEHSVKKVISHMRQRDFIWPPPKKADWGDHE
jgi:hypothetical protein